MSPAARLSNTYALYKRGWRGVVVEPTSSLTTLHKKWTPYDLQFQGLIGDEDGLSPFYQIYPSVLSTTKQRRLQQAMQKEAVLISSNTLKVLTLKTLITQFAKDKRVDFMTVNIEGTDLMAANQVAALPDFLRPHVLCFESNDKESTQTLLNVLETEHNSNRQLGCNFIFWNE